jgi:energy-coupling factor transport system ATP-binding protein
MDHVAISLDHVSFIYPNGIQALDNIDLQIEKGEFLVVMGANGAGKTTLLLHLNGVIPQIIEGASRGEVVLDSQNISGIPVYELSTRIGLVRDVPDDQILFPQLKMEVCFGPENLGVDPNEILRRLEWSLGAVGLKGFENRSPTDLSGGQKQRAVIAACLSMLPDILVLDEPTSQLDPVGTSQILAVINELNEKHGKTIVMSSHNSAELVDLADRIVLLQGGKIIRQGEPREVLQDVKLLEGAGVAVPQVTKLAHSLRGQTKPANLPLTLPEAIKYLSGLLDEKKVVPSMKMTERRRKPHGPGVLLEMVDVWFEYAGPPPVLALKGINLKIHEGEFVGVIGQNGSGKSTLVKNLVGLLRPTKGEIFVAGENARNKTVPQLATRIGLVLQNPDHQLFKYRARDEIEFGLRNLGLPDDLVQTRVDEVLQTLELTHLKESYPLSLSFGDRMKLTVASVVAMKPSVMIFDEPTTGQDYRGRHEIMQVAKKLHDTGLTMIVISHDMELIAEYVERVVVLGEGQILADGASNDVFAHPEILEKTFLKPPQISTLAQSLSKYGLRNATTIDEMLAEISTAGN